MGYTAAQSDAAALSGGGAASLPQHKGPGSNGYKRRELWFRNGAFSWTAPKDGKIKIYALGAGGGGANASSNFKKGGGGGGLCMKETTVSAGDVLTVTVGAGGAGGTSTGADGGTTTVVCAAASIAMTANGGEGGDDNTNGGTASGGDVNYSGGGQVTGINADTGGASSASPWGDGFSAKQYGYGGCGWGGNTDQYVFGGASSHRGVKANTSHGASGLAVRGGEKTYLSSTYGGHSGNPHGRSSEWWDLSDVDGAGGSYLGASSTNEQYTASGSGGMGAGGAGGQNGTSGGEGGFGGGGGFNSYNSSNAHAGNGGNGGGGGGRMDNSAIPGGDGGDGAVIIYWDEV